MLLRGSDGSELELRVLGYRFRDGRRDPWDDNWLVVRVRVTAPHGSWQVDDPCLTTFEAAHVVRWLAGVAIGDPRVRPTLEEPNVALAVVDVGADRVTLHTSFELETRPPWAVRGRVWVDLDVARGDLLEAAHDLQDDLRRFPPRAADPTL